MLSYTLRESNRAAPWNNMPMRARRACMSRPLRRLMSSPKTFTVPLLGVMRPMMCLMRTDLPEPEPPMTTVICLAGMSRSMPFNT
jgi:hypothetical protein